MYPDLLNSYGDAGNVAILTHRLAARGFKANVHPVSVKDKFEPDAYDIVLLGGGQFHEQSVVAEDLMRDKGAALKDYVHAGKVALLICGGYQLAGEYYVDDKGEREDGLGILPIYSTSGDVRLIGNIVVEAENGELYTGFENHLGKTYIGDLQPLGRVVNGFGNNGEDGYEGCVFKNTYATYMHGPLLSKNPEIADRMIETAFKLRGEDVKLEPIDDEWERLAKATQIRKISEK